MSDIRKMDAAIDQWALEYGKMDGDLVLTNEVALYLKTPWNSRDPLQNAYVIGRVGTNQIRIANTTKEALAGVGLDWGSY
jgi:hypothetical protein